MVNPGLYFAFVAAVAVLMIIPGPNVAMIVATSMSHGPRHGMLTVAGTASAMLVQLALTGLGLAGVLGQAGQVFGWVRWAGVAYLLWLGVVYWRAPAADLAQPGIAAKSGRQVYLRSWFLSLFNPKTLLFYGAFFPQFIDPARGATAQIAILAITALSIGFVIDTGWALSAARVRHWRFFSGRARNRLTGTLMIGAGAGLALARVK